MDEILKYQESLINSLERENGKYEELQSSSGLDQLVSKTKDYHEKLVNSRRSMLIMKDKTSRLKRKINKLMEEKNREDLERQRSRERREILEKHLEPVVNTSCDNK